MQNHSNITEFISNIRIEGFNAFLPSIKLDRDVFNKKVKRPLADLGGTWNTALQCFEFPFDPSARIRDLAAGKKVKLSSAYHYFDTDIDLVGHMLMFAQEAGIDWSLLDFETAKVLEPGAGRGNILKNLAVKGFRNLFYYELMPENREVLCREISRLNLPAKFLGEDFLQGSESDFQMVIANPPYRFELIQIERMVSVLKPGGILITLSSPKLYNDNDFIKYLDSVSSKWEMREIVADKESPIFEGTDIGCTIIVAKKKVEYNPQLNLFKP